MMTNWQALRTTHLIETEALDAQIAGGDPRLRIVDMRGYVKTHTTENGFQNAEYLGAQEDYADLHLPGAIYLDWTRDIVDEADPIPAQIADAEKIAQVLGQAGLGDDSHIVAYDSHPASQFATRLWWVLRYYGHDNVRVLNGGWMKWLGERRAVTSDVPRYASAVFTPHPRPEWRATAEQVRDLLGSPDVSLLDARDAGQYTGRIQRGKRGGHIPGAKNLPREALFAPDGTFRDPESFQQIVDGVGVTPEKRVVAYCNGGVAATSALFALSMLGYAHLTNYDGSWNEWSERKDLPIV